MEIEENGRIPFLDLEIIHENNTLSSSWYTKPTDTGLIMNYHALAPKRYKRSVVQSFVHRIYRCCSSWKNFTDSLQRAKTILERNQYPPDFYEPIIGETVNKMRSCEEREDSQAPDAQVPTQTKLTHRMYIQYRGSVTDTFVKQLLRVNAPTQVVITIRKIRTFLSPLKASVPKDILNQVVYQIICPSCQACYVGQTHRHIRTRFSEHRNKKKEPVRKHFESCTKRKAVFSDLNILDKTSCSITFLQTLEALYIMEIKPILNTKDEYKSRELTIIF